MITVLFKFVLIYLLFNWRIIAVQNFVVFCQASTWISRRGKNFFYLDLFKSLVEFDTLWLLVSFSFFGHQAFGSLAPQSGIKPTAPCIGRQSLNCWTAREVLITVLLAEVHAFFVSPQLFPNVLFLPQEPHMTFYPHVSLDSSGLRQFLSLFFFF